MATTQQEIYCSPVSLKIKPHLSNKTPILVKEVLADPDLKINPVNTIELNQRRKKFKHLKHISFSNVDDKKVSIIIGIDNFELIHFSKVIKGPKNTSWAVVFPLGWTCAGKTIVTAEEQNTMFETQISSHCHLDNNFATKVQQWTKNET